MIEQMEEEGVVGPQEGTKPREVYVDAIGVEDV
jgi:DNA segregation ATPase FtsK/SpoIIIE-like protein